MARERRNKDMAMAQLHERAAKLRREGHSYMQVYRCGGCGVRITIENANQLFRSAICDLCEDTTEITGGWLLEILSGGTK